MKKPISVQFKFFEDIKTLTDPTEPRMPTMEMPAQDQKKLSKRMKRYQIPILVPLFILACALALCGCLFLVILYQHL